MANRRMISKSVVDNAPFVECSKGARYLYYEMNTHADDDGLIKLSKRFMAGTECTEEEVQELLECGLIIDLGGDIYAIKDWYISNMIQGNRYHQTIYINALEKLQKNADKTYSLKPLNTMLTQCEQDVNTLLPQVSIGKVSIDEDSIGEVRSDKDSTGKAREGPGGGQTFPYSQGVKELFEEYLKHFNISKEYAAYDLDQLIRSCGKDSRKATAKINAAISNNIQELS